MASGDVDGIEIAESNLNRVRIDSNNTEAREEDIDVEGN